MTVASAKEFHINRAYVLPRHIHNCRSSELDSDFLLLISPRVLPIAGNARSSHGTLRGMQQEIGTAGRAPGAAGITDRVGGASAHQMRTGNVVFGIASLVLMSGLSACAGSAASPGPDSPVEAPSSSTGTSRDASSSSTASGANDNTALNPRLTLDGSREAAVDELVRQYTEAAKNGSQTDAARAFVEQHGEAATRAYTDGRHELSQVAREKLLRVLLSFNSEVAVPAFVEAIEQYTETGENVDEAIWASQAATQRAMPGYREALLEAFRAIDTSDKDGLRYSRHLAAAMSHQRTSDWAPALIAELSVPLKRPARFDDTKGVKAFQSGLFRQTISARLLGELAAPEATEPLLKVLLDADKRELHPIAELSVARLAPSLLPRLVNLLSADDAELVELTRKARPDLSESHLYFATKWADLLRHPGTEKALLAAWTKTKNPVSRTLLVRSLSRLPASTAGIEPLKATFLATNIKVTLPEGESALEVLADSAVEFFDPSIVPWLNARAGSVPAVWSRRADVQHALIAAMSALATEEQLKSGRAAALKYGGKSGMSAFEQAERLVQACRADSSCYSQTLTSEQSEAFILVKAATMLALLGEETAIDALVESAKRLEAPAPLAQVLSALEHLSVGRAQATGERLAQLLEQSGTGPDSSWPRAKTSAVQSTVARLSAW